MANSRARKRKYDYLDPRKKKIVGGLLGARGKTLEESSLLRAWANMAARDARGQSLSKQNV